MGRSVAIQDDGKIVAGGQAGSKAVVVRFNPDGSLDEDFGDGGRVLIDLGG